MTNSQTKQSLSEKDISKLSKEVGDLKLNMCTITDHISTPRIDRGCNMSKDLEDLINDLTPGKATPKIIDEIRTTLEDISDIAVGIEVGIEEILVPARKTKKHYHEARKIITNPISQQK